MVSTVLSSLAFGAGPAFAANVPGAPTNVTATQAGTTSIDVQWDDPANDGGANISDFKVYYSTNAGSTWTLYNDGTSNNNDTTVTVASGNNVIFQIAARNSAGEGPASAPSNSVKTGAKPSTSGKPTVSYSSATGNTTLTFTAPSNTYSWPVLHYLIRYSTNSGNSWTTSETQFPTASAVFSSLPYGTYVFQSAAVTGYGQGNWSSSSTSTTIQGPPTAPTLRTFTPAPGQVTANWNAPSAPAAYPVSDYETRYTSDSGSTWTTFTGATSTTTSEIVDGLTNGTGYEFQVRAYNALGWSPWSSSSSTITPSSVPDAPVDVAAVVKTNSQNAFTVTWNAGASNGGNPITNYLLQRSSNGGVTWSNSTSVAGTSTTVSSLTGGTTYMFRVAAENAAGTSSWSTPSSGVTAVSYPTAPQNVSVTVGDGSLDVAWSAPSNAVAAPVTSYLVKRTSSAGTVTVTLSSDARTTTLSGLTNGTTYSITVTATSAAGSNSSSISTAVVATPGPTPSAPTGLAQTVSGDRTLNLTWGAAALSNGAGTVDSYEVAISSNGGSTWTTLTTTDGATLVAASAGLTAGSSYVFRVRAHNSTGWGSWSATSAAAVAATTPAAVATPSVSVTGNTITVSFTAGDDGYSPITTYRATCTNSATGAAVSSSDNTGTIILSAPTVGDTYTCTAAVANAAGYSTESAPSSGVVPYGAANAPASVDVAPDDGSLTVTWSPVAPTAAAPVEGYVVTLDGATACTTSGTSCLIGGLTNGTSYTVTVYAYYANTNGATSTPQTGTPRTAPDAPTSVTATADGDGTATISFASGANGGSPLVDFDFEYSTDPAFANGSGTFVENGTSTALAQTVSGLTNGVTYYFRVRATNATGDSAWSNASNGAHPYTTPGTPTNINATEGSSQATITWSAPASSGGSGITGYRVTVYNSSGGAPNGVSGLTTRTVGTTPAYTFTGLSADTTYTFAVEAINAAGYSNTSDRSNSVTPYTTPDAPNTPVAAIDRTTATVTFTAGASDHGRTVDSYTVTCASIDGGTTRTVTDVPTSPATIGQLTAGAHYTCTVSAHNAAGYSAPSTPSNSFFAYDSATAIYGLTATAGDETLDVSWDMPAVVATTPIEGYVVLVDGSTACTTTDRTDTTCTITGLENGRSYTLAVYAYYATTAGVVSDMIDATPYTTPDAPTSVTCTTPAADTLNCSWNTPAWDGGANIVSYQVTVEENISGSWQTVDSAQTTDTQHSFHLPDSYGHQLRATVTAENAAGASSPSSPSATTLTYSTPHAAVSSLSCSSGDESALCSFTPASDNGNLTGRTWQYRTQAPNGVWTAWATSSSTTFTAANLTNGDTYTVAVRQTNNAGVGPATETTVTPYTTPSAVTISNLQRSVSGTLKVTFIPGSNGGNTIFDYDFEYSLTANFNNSVRVENGTNTANLQTISGLTDGTPYWVRVRGENAAGAGAWSTPFGPVAPSAVPGAPAVAVTAGDTTVTVNWTSEAGDTSLLEHEIRAVDENGNTIDTIDVPERTTTNSSTYVFDGLENGTSYRFVVRSRNEAGWGATSPVSTAVTPFGTPDTPSGIRAQASDRTIVVTWDAPTFDGGSPVVGYTVSYTTNGGTTWTSGVTSVGETYTFSSLTNGTIYRFRVRATNAAGNSSWSSTSAASTPYTTSDAPAVTATVTANRTVEVTWTPGASDGGASVDGWKIERSENGGAWQTISTVASGVRATTAGSLTLGRNYTFRVSGHNAAGWSATASASVSGALVAAPSAVTGAAAAGGDGTITVSWNAPDYTINGDGKVTAVTVTLGGVVRCSATSAAVTSCTINGLTNGVVYQVGVRATGPGGNGTAWNKPVTVAAAPPTPAVVTAYRQTGGMTVSWSFTNTASVNSFVTITLVEAQTSIDGGTTWQNATVTGATSPVTITPSNFGVAQTVRVRLTNATGTSGWSVASNQVTPVGAPTGANVSTVVAGDAKASIGYTVAATGGAPVTRVEVQSSTNSGSTWTTAVAKTVGTLHEISGLRNGTSYTFRVRAWNATGSSPWSAASTTVVPYETIGAPKLSAVSGSDRTTLAWTAIASTPARTITGYVAYQGTTEVCRTTSSVRTCQVTGLTAGTKYAYSVRAIANAYQGTLSGAVVVTPRSNTTYLWPAPAVAATAGDEAGTITFTPATRSTATQFEGHNVYVNGALECRIVRGSPTSCPLSGLTNSSRYTIQIGAYLGDLQGPLSTAVEITPQPWTAPAPSALTARVFNGDIVVTGKAVPTPGVTGYVVTRNGVTVGTVQAATYTDKAAGTSSGTRTYTITAVGPKGRVGTTGTVSITVAAAAKPTVAVTPGARGTVTLTPAAMAVPANSAWIVVRNGVTQKRVELSSQQTVSTPVVLTGQPKGSHTFQLRLETPTGQSELSNATPVSVA